MLESIGQFIYFIHLVCVGKRRKEKQKEKVEFRGISRRTTRPRAVEAWSESFHSCSGSRRLYLRHTSTFRFPRFL